MFKVNEVCSLTGITKTELEYLQRKNYFKPKREQVPKKHIIYTHEDIYKLNKYVEMKRNLIKLQDEMMRSLK